MSYTKQTWETGDVITDDKLNHMEDGIATGGGVLVVNATMDGATVRFGKTWQEICDAPFAVGVLVNEQGDNFMKLYISITQITVEQSIYKVYTVLDGAEAVFTADSADGYPTATMG